MAIIIGVQELKMCQGLSSQKTSYLPFGSPAQGLFWWNIQNGGNYAVFKTTGNPWTFAALISISPPPCEGVLYFPNHAAKFNTQLPKIGSTASYYFETGNARNPKIG